MFLKRKSRNEKLCPLIFSNVISKNKWGQKEEIMKRILVILLMLAVVVFGVEKMKNRNFKSTLSDKYGLPLDDGTYKVTFKFYDSSKDGVLLEEEVKLVKCEDGICIAELESLQKLAKDGYTIIWIGIKTDNIPESVFRIKKYLDKPIK